MFPSGHSPRFMVHPRAYVLLFIFLMMLKIEPGAGWRACRCILCVLLYSIAHLVGGGHSKDTAMSVRNLSPSHPECHSVVTILSWMSSSLKLGCRNLPRPESGACVYLDHSDKVP